MKNLLESGLAKIQAKMELHDIGTITAFRAAKTKAENLANNRKLLTYLIGKKYSVTQVKGAYIEDLSSDNPKEVGEVSFFVADHKASGTLFIDLKKMGDHFEQDSILFKPLGEPAFIIGTSDSPTAWPARNVKVKFSESLYGKVNGQYFSRIKGRQFAFESIEYIPPPDNMGGMQGLKYEFDQINSELMKNLNLVG